MEASTSKPKGTAQIVVDASGQIAGRLSSNVAKLLLGGQRVIVVNAQEALISGTRKMIVGEYTIRLEIGGAVHPKYGPFHHRAPDRILSRMVRGMLPKRKTKGIESIKRLRIYVGIPLQYDSASRTVFENAKATRPRAFYLTLSEVARAIGWKGEQ